MSQGCLVSLIEKYGLLLAEIQHLLLSAGHSNLQNRTAAACSACSLNLTIPVLHLHY